MKGNNVGMGELQPIQARNGRPYAYRNWLYWISGTRPIKAVSKQRKRGTGQDKVSKYFFQCPRYRLPFGQSCQWQKFIARFIVKIPNTYALVLSERANNIPHILLEPRPLCAIASDRVPR